MSIFSILIIILICIVVYKVLSGKGVPDNSYTPFDYITGQSDTEFHEEDTEEKEHD
ncbi:MAG TPA: DUF3951 domain-containing protein [Bacillota bacterium]|nr:DUF3951 domain-containing protein [Bacillota bacterium]